MKKKIVLTSIILILVVSIANICLGFSLDMNLDKTKSIKENDEIILTLKTSEKIIGASFKMNVSSDLELVESASDNLSVSDNNGKIACVYVDTAKKETDTLKIKFKAKKDITKNLDFSLEDAKFISASDETTFDQSKIDGIEKTIQIQSGTTISDDSKNNNTNSNGNTSKNDNTSKTDNKNNTNQNSNENKINNNNTIKQNTTKIKSDTSKSASTIPYTGTNTIILVIAIIAATISTVYFGIKMKSNK